MLFILKVNPSDLIFKKGVTSVLFSLCNVIRLFIFIRILSFLHFSLFPLFFYHQSLFKFSGFYFIIKPFPELTTVRSINKQ